MTFGEAGSSFAFAALAFLSLIIAAKAYTPEYAFHAYLFTAAFAASAFTIANRYYDRPAERPPLTISGKPNYNMGPVKFSTIAAVVWGIAGFTIGLLIALQLAFSGAELRHGMAVIRPHAAAAHLGGHLCLRRQRADRVLLLCRAAHLPRQAGG
jgi:hypothetical protein